MNAVSISVNDLTMSYGDRTLFQDVSLNLGKKSHVGLVGANGAGKTTFLKILCGKLQPSSGTINLPNGVEVGMLDQDTFRYLDEKVISLALMGKKRLWNALERKKALLKKESLDKSEIDELSVVEEQIRLQKGYQAEAEAARLLEGLGISASKHDGQLRNLSGGYQLRVLLAQVLFGEPDLLLLDEPTNYLDIFSIRWLEEYLRDYPKTFLLSSHDRYFLNNVCNGILDVDYGEIKHYQGNFNDFLQKKEEGIAQKEAQLKSMGKRKEEIKRFIDRFKAKSSKARQAQSRVRMVKKLEEEEKQYQLLPTSRSYPHFRFPICRNSARAVLKVKEIDKAFGSLKVLQKISFSIERQEKVALVGANGIGKSTLLEILTNHQMSDQGTFIWGGYTKIAYFPQHFHRLLKSEMTLYDWLESHSGCHSKEKLRQTLGAMLFGDQEIRQKVSSLSGGEAARLYFGALMLMEHNILILDEPTNHLDMEATDALIEALHDYHGTLLIVSHNRYFISQIANRVIELQQEKVLDFQGGYQEFVEVHQRDYLTEKRPTLPKQNKTESNHEKERLLKKEIQKWERKCQKIEKELETLDYELADPHFYQKTPQSQQDKKLKERSELEDLRQEAYKKWEELEDELH